MNIKTFVSVFSGLFLVFLAFTKGDTMHGDGVRRCLYLSFRAIERAYHDSSDDGFGLVFITESLLYRLPSHACVA